MKSSYLMSTYCVLGFRGSYCRFKTTGARMLEVLTGQSELGPHSWGAEPLWHQAHIDSMQSLCQSREDGNKCELGRAVTGLYGSQSSQLVISTLGMRRRKMSRACPSQPMVPCHGQDVWRYCSQGSEGKDPQQRHGWEEKTETHAAFYSLSLGRLRLSKESMNWNLALNVGFLVKHLLSLCKCWMKRFPGIQIKIKSFKL